MNWLLRYYVPALSLLGFAGFCAALGTGLDPSIAVAIVSVIALASATALERRRPYRRAWNNDAGDLKTDLTSAALLAAIVDPALKLLAPLLVLWLYTALEAGRPQSPVGLWVEIPIVLLMAELGKYWAHRIHHGLPCAWWLHALHHGSTRLYALNGLRFHPLNYAINFALGILPLMLLGASSESIAAYLALTQPIVMVQHANVALSHGWLNTLFSTPEAHRLHHSTRPHEGNANYGNAILLWDHAFGTYRRHGSFADDAQVGLFESSRTYPSTAGYWSQLASMFKPSCCAA